MTLDLQALLDEYARDGGDVAALLRSATTESPIDLAGLESAAADAFRALRSGETITDADVESMEALADVIESIRGEQTHVAAQAAEQQARIDAIAERIAPPAATDSDSGTDTGADGDSGADGDPGGEATAEADTDPTGDNDTGNAGTGAAGVGDAGAADAASVVAEAEAAAAAAAESGAGVPVLAAAPTRRRVDLARVAQRTAQPATPARQQSRDVILAAADVLGVAAGAPFPDFNSVATAAQRRFQAYGRAGKSTKLRNGLAVFQKDFPAELTADGTNDQEVLDYAASEARLPGGSLLAAGGWCAPSEIMYELCDLQCSLDGMITAAEVNAPRGGLRWTKGVDFCDIFNSPGFFHFTEPEMEAGAVKPCMEVPCPDFTECRLDVDGLCIQSDILQRRGYPETIAQFIEGALCAHAHKLNAHKINKMVQGSYDDGVIGGDCGGATAEVLEALELQVEAYKSRRRLARSVTLEIVAPFWLRAVIRSDLARRNGVDMLAVTDAQITAWFALRGVSVHWVYDWQELKKCSDAPNATVEAFPSEVEIMLYQAGTWVFLTQDVITLDTLYDSTLLKRNKYMALFTEEGICVINRCFESRRFRVPICPSGVTGGQPVCECPPDIS